MLIQLVDSRINENIYDLRPGRSNLTHTRDPRSSGSGDNTFRNYYAPNNLNQLDTLSDQLNRSTANTYDRSGNLTQVTLPNGMSITYTYDSANR